MIIVTGTKRSGTSLWMQVLVAAGFPAFGEAFPRNWGDTIRAANPDGFLESMLRQGIYYRTNPHPVTGAYFRPEQVERHVVKVFVPGLVRTDLAFIGKVVATMRPVQEYERSLERLYRMEEEHLDEPQRALAPSVRMPAALEWWAENFALIRDLKVRGYPVHIQSYDGLLERPDEVIEKTLTWLGGGDLQAARAVVKPEYRSQAGGTASSIEARFLKVFDELYQTINAGQPLTRSFIQRLNQTNEALQPSIREWTRKVQLDARQRQQRMLQRETRTPASTSREEDGSSQ